MKALVLCLLGVVSLFAQPDRDLGRAPVPTRRLALVIGNDAYTAANALHNAVNDATGMKAALEAVGFTVQVGVNLTQQQMETKIDDFTGSVRPGDTALFFYSGHGMQISDQNYLVPVDFNARTAVDAKYKAYPAQRVQENLEAAGVSLQIIILDACRNNPFRSWRGGSDGLAAMNAGRGTYIAFATGPGRVADDNPGGQNGLFTGELIRVLGQPGLSIDQLFNRVREQVSARSHGAQLPWSTSSVIRDFYFRPAVESTPSIPAAGEPSPQQHSDIAVELAFWNSVKDEKDPALLEEYLHKYPNGEFATIARARIARLKTPPPPPRVVSSVTPKEPASPTQSNGTITVAPIQGAQATRGSEFMQAVSVQVKEGFHVNSNKPEEEYLIPLRLTWTGPIEVEEVIFPQPERMKFEFSVKPMVVYAGTFEILSKLKVPANAPDGPNMVTGKLHYQACNQNACLRPQTIDLKFSLDIR